MTLQQSKKQFTLKEIREQLEVPRKTMEDTVKRLFPDKMQNGKTTYLNEVEVSLISKELKKAHNTDLASIRQVAMTKLEQAEIVAQAIKILQQNIEELQPKAEKYDRLMATENYISVGEFAKSIGFGRNKLYEKLREMKILDQYNMPYQAYMNYFTVRHIEKNGQNFPTTFLNARGINYLSDRII